MKIPLQELVKRFIRRLLYQLLIPSLLISAQPVLAFEGVPRTNLLSPITEDITVTGTVVDENGEPVPGATVSIPGTGIGTATDIDGRYSLSVPEGSTLVFSFIGFETQSIEVGAQSIVNVTLIEDMAALDEVVVIGYGTQKKSDLTGSVVRVSMEDRGFQANTNLIQALSGAAAGVNVQGAGLAGSEPNLSIRGQTSLSASDNPL